ncbi:MAG: GNAT family N-acetyltransferase [Alphaproteobacteria bacterium]
MGHSAALPAPQNVQEQGSPSGLVVAPAGDLDRHRGAIDALAQRALMPNPFFLPAFLAPAMAAFGKGRVQLALLYDRGELVFFAPVIDNPVTSRLFHTLRVWTHDFAPLGTPLMPRKRARDVAALLSEAMRRQKIGTLIIPDAPLGVLEVAAIRKAVVRGGGGEVMARQCDRSILCAHDIHDRDAASQEIARLVSAKRRKEMRRQLRRLDDVGPVRFGSADHPDDITAAMAEFLALEAAGWKGRAGTAMVTNPVVGPFARSAVANLAQDGRVRIDTLHAGDRLAASLISFRCRGLAVPWKIAFAEDLAACSPGAQLMLSATRAWLADPDIRRVDPVCGADHPMLQLLWRDTDRYATVVLGPGGKGATHRMLGATDRLIERTRRKARRLRDTARARRR